MSRDNLKTWMNVLPMNKWTTLYDDQDKPVTTFKLRTYSVTDGVPNYIIETKGGTQALGGMQAVPIGKHLSVRLHIPVELHKVPGIGLSPKMVYKLPRPWRIEEYKAPPPPEEQIYEAARKHRIVSQ